MRLLRESVGQIAHLLLGSLLKYISQLILIVREFGNFLIHIRSPIDIGLLGLSDGQVASRYLHRIILHKLHVVLVRVFEA